MSEDVDGGNVTVLRCSYLFLFEPVSMKNEKKQDPLAGINEGKSLWISFVVQFSFQIILESDQDVDSKITTKHSPK
jgi:hypothetical protein